jgi:demethylmenaquinone methyltransferase/2-methoxy-6-polyprenyl-1,4-benzoquinol methylase
LDPDEKMLKLNQFSTKIVGHSENLPFEDESFDSVYSTFVWRNIDSVDLSMSEIYRVLNPGGKFVLLDMSRPKNKLLQVLHKIGTYKVLHIIGLLTFNLKEYRFLHKSLDKYPQPEAHLKKNNFEKLEIYRMGLFNFVYLAVFTK